MTTTPSSKGVHNIADFNRIRLISVLFLLTIVGFIVYLIYTSSSFPYDGKAINIAGRQRMLTQNITQAVAYVGQPNITVEEKVFLEALAGASKTFGDTLNGFANGGVTRDADSSSDVELKKVQNPKLQKTIKDAQTIWSGLEPSVEELKTKGQLVGEKELTILKNKLALESPVLLMLMNDLTVGLEVDSANKNRNLLISLITTLVLTLVYFFYIVAYSLSKLKTGEERLNDFANSMESSNSALEKSNRDLSNTRDILEVSLRESDEKSKELTILASDLNRLKEESDKIFSSVDHGLCLLTPNYKIGNRVSDATYKIFEREKLAGFSFIDLMRPLISEKDLSTLKSYLKLQFDGKTLAKQLEKYNPLKNVEINMNWDGENFSNKFVGFDFERITSAGKVELVLVTITDITDRVVLQRSLQESAEEQRMQSEILLELMNVDGSSFQRVILQSEREVDEINELLKNEKVERGMEEKNRSELIDEIFRKVHNIKGNAAVIGLNKLAGIAHSVEDELSALKRRSDNITGDAVLSSLVQLSAMRELISDYQETRDQFRNNFRTGPATVPIATAPIKEEDKIYTELTSFATKIAEKLDKKVHLRTKLDFKGVKSERIGKVKDIYAQLIRNSLVHGIETIKVRRAAGKLEEGFIYLASERIVVNGDEKLRFTFRDDGQGINLERIKNAALSKGLIEEDSPELNNIQYLVKLIFQPGFSTADQTSDVAGRGTGMDIVRNTIVQDLDGKMSLCYSKGNYTEFNWEIPLE